MSKAISRRLKSDRRGVSNVIVVMLSLVLVVIIVGNVVLWSYQMNQLDWEKMQEKIALIDVEHMTHSPWFTSQSEYAINVGSRSNGTYLYTQTADSNYETFVEESPEFAPISYNPAGYTLVGPTKYVSGVVSDLATDNGMYMVFRSYSSTFSSQTLYTHNEVKTIAGQSYYQLKLGSADSAGSTLQADASTTGRKSLAKLVYPLTGITSIPASTWILYYRGYKTGFDTQVVIHCDVDIAIRKADGTIRTTVATNAADSANLNRDTWSTVSGTYVWANYAVLNDTDFLEIDYYAHVTTSQAGRNAYLRIDDFSLPLSDQARISSIMLPSSYTVEVELSGSSNTQTWQNLTWTINSAFTTGNLNVTMQLYNYSASQYPINGDGYITYISTSTPSTDETRNQTITTNPTYFRGSAGEWKAKILGVKQANSPFDLKVDWIEFKTMSRSNFGLDVVGDVALDTFTYPLAYVQSIEIQIHYRANDSLENWFLKAYNWTSGQYSNAGFNSTGGDTPTSGFSYYAVNLTDAGESYVQSGVMKIKFCDNSPDASRTSVDVDFLGVRLAVDGARFSFENTGSSTCHVVAIWVINATQHSRYSADFFLNSGGKSDYFRADISLPTNNFTVRIVTERGNAAIFRID